MKTVFYILLLLVELVVGFLAISLAWANTAWIPCIITVLVWAVLLVWQIILLTKAADAEVRRKIRRRIALVMLIPTIGFIIMVICLIVGLSSVI